MIITHLDLVRPTTISVDVKHTSPYQNPRQSAFSDVLRDGYLAVAPDFEFRAGRTVASE
jgi:hypothetical protein